MIFHASGSSPAVVATWHGEVTGGGDALGRGDAIAARALLARLGAGPGEMARLRRLAADRLPARWSGLDDHAVLDRLAAWVAAGELRLRAIPELHLSSWGDTDAEEAGPAAAAPLAARAEPEPAPAAEEATFPADIDAEAIAAALQEAARTGVPFCEECTRKKLRAQRAAREART